METLPSSAKMPSHSIAMQSHRQPTWSATTPYRSAYSVQGQLPTQFPVNPRIRQANGYSKAVATYAAGSPIAGFEGGSKARNAAAPGDEFVFPRTGKRARNRSVLAAMTNRQSLPDGRLSQDEHNWLVMRAANGFGIVTTACAHVSQEGQGFDGEVGVWSDSHVEGLSLLAGDLRDHGALSLLQIFHAGMRAPQHLTGKQPISASANQTEASFTGCTRSLSEQEIRRIINDFAKAARRAADAGFDGVELHGAHGYLICQFLSTTHNQRRDCWGGSLENRARFLFEIIKAVKNAVPSDFIIGVRISPEHQGVKLEESLALASMLTKVDIDFLHLSCWDSFKGARGRPNDRRTLTEWFTSTIPNLPPVITAGDIWTCEDAKKVMNMGADLVAVARSAIGNPDWANGLTDPTYRPVRPPYSPAHLSKCGLNNTFIHYMRNWQGFVTP